MTVITEVPQYSPRFGNYLGPLTFLHLDVDHRVVSLQGLLCTLEHWYLEPIHIYLDVVNITEIETVEGSSFYVAIARFGVPHHVVQMCVIGTLFGCV